MEATPGVRGPETRKRVRTGPLDPEASISGALEVAEDDAGDGETEEAASEDEARARRRHLRLGARDACAWVRDELWCSDYAASRCFRGRRTR